MIYHEPGTPSTRAIYFDNEGHVINYAAQFSHEGNTLTFLSDPMTSAPRFRLIYTKNQDGTLAVKFEIAPPGKPDSFSTYLEGKARRKSTL